MHIARVVDTLSVGGVRYPIAKGSFFDSFLTVPGVKTFVQLAQPRREAAGEFLSNTFRHRGTIGANDITCVAAAAFHARCDRWNRIRSRTLIGVIAVTPFSLFVCHLGLDRDRFGPEGAENVTQNQHYVQRFDVGETFGEENAAAIWFGPVNVVVMARNQMDDSARWPMLCHELPQIEILLAVHMSEDD